MLSANIQTREGITRGMTTMRPPITASPSAPVAPASAAPATRPTRDSMSLVGQTVEFNWRRTLTMSMFVMQYTLLFCHVWPAIVPEASHGILAFAQREGPLTPSVMATVFLFCIGITWRGPRPRLWLLGMLLGQGILAVLTVMYAARGMVTLAQVA